MSLTIKPLTYLFVTLALSTVAEKLLKEVYLTYVEVGLRPATALLIHGVLRLLM